MTERTRYVTDVTGCARCGGRHTGLEFESLDRPMSIMGGSREATFWAMCPTSGQPIMMLVVPHEDGDFVREAGS